MHRALLGLAVSIAAVSVSTPTVARDGSFVGRPTAPAGGFVSPGFRGNLCRDRDRRVDRCRSDVLMDWYGGEWALYNNRSWAPDSYNDWWHDRPDRAYPAWMRNNQDCQRQWFSGDVLRC